MTLNIVFNEEFQRYEATYGTIVGCGKTEEEAIRNMYIAMSYGADRDYGWGPPN